MKSSDYYFYLYLYSLCAEYVYKILERELKKRDLCTRIR